ncbi:putative molybdopterin synthase subunit MoaE [Magnetofaba australis IT-1]|uniref:Molybdopterin adenylyltransferase n=1 Tax=Magnetofaba australis IT-1 TaxID=1434232 RepID=A0A1Y2K7B9_9PROT|nr:putative molybdopterin synthase subunit MoaE [Magnetofaba australis IT-1]
MDEETRALLAHNPRIGGIVTFLGTVRDFSSGEDVQAIELEHYPGMTELELERIEQAALARFSIDAITVVHRVGRLTVSENIVLVIAASMHRAAAFEACRYVIDHLKVRATFWKKEFTAQGERWVDSCPGCEAAASQWDDLKAGHTHADASDKAHDHSHHHHHAHDAAAHRDHDHAISWAGLNVGVLTLSDSRTLAQDASGDALEGMLLNYGAQSIKRALLADEQAAIEAHLRQWADVERLDVILTTGGTGPGPRDCTPEATRTVTNRELPGFAELIRSAGLEQTRTAVFTRGVSAFRQNCLIINLPGSRRGSAHSLQAVADLVPHALRMALGGGHG